MKIAVSTDHVGFQQIREVRNYIEQLGHEVIYFGPEEFNEDDDYPDFIFPAAKAVANGEADLGVIFGGSGQGEAMAANRIKGVRCAVYYGPSMPQGPVNAEGSSAKDEFEILRLSKEHNDANMLSLSARFLDEDQVETAIKIWLETPFIKKERHARRTQKLDNGI